MAADPANAEGAAAWAYALRTYAEDGVAPACLLLQDRLGVDVVVMLHAMYRARMGAALGRDEIAGMDAAVREWRSQVVAPLRSVRRALKTRLGGFAPDQVHALREQVKSVELMAERKAFELLAQAAEPPRSAPQIEFSEVVREVALWYSQAAPSALMEQDVREALLRLGSLPG
jgi:uncharacterized protein (TIGR02444 family)